MICVENTPAGGSLVCKGGPDAPDKVYFADMRTDYRGSMFTKVGRLLDCCAIDKRIAANDLVAVKVHFGERGNHAFVRPVFVRKVVEQIKIRGARPFLTDSSTLYPGIITFVRLTLDIHKAARAWHPKVELHFLGW